MNIDKFLNDHINWAWTGILFIFFSLGISIIFHTVYTTTKLPIAYGKTMDYIQQSHISITRHNDSTDKEIILLKNRIKLLEGQLTWSDH